MAGGRVLSRHRRGFELTARRHYFRAMTYAEAMAELEQILAQLREVPADIDQLHARVARAEQLLAACRAKLRGVEEGLIELRQQTE